MDISTVINTLQLGLSVVGFLAISIWMMRWAKGFHERSKELSEIDKEIRATLKDSLVAQKELHAIGQKKLEIELANLLDGMKKHTKDIHTEKKISNAAFSTIDVICNIATLTQGFSIDSETNKVREHYLRLIDILISNKIVTKDKFYEYWKKRPNEPFSSTEEEVVWRLTEMYDEPTRLQTRLQTLVSTMIPITPIAFDFFLKNPEASQQEINEFVADFFRQQATEIRAEVAG